MTFRVRFSPFNTFDERIVFAVGRSRIFLTTGPAIATLIFRAVLQTWTFYTQACYVWLITKGRFVLPLRWIVVNKKERAEASRNEVRGNQFETRIDHKLKSALYTVSR